jgi:hypothetical protein
MSPTQNAVEIRRANLGHEAAIKSVGILYYIASVLSFIAAVGSPFDTHEKPHLRIIIGILMALLSYAYWKLGEWFRGLNAKARTPGTILACFGLLGVPLGTVISAYVLYLINSRKGKIVFSDEYKAVVAETPDIAYRISKVVWYLIYFTVAVIALAILGLIFRR